MACALLALLVILPDFPTSDRGNRHLSKAELELVRRRLAFDRHGMVTERMTVAVAIKLLLNWKTWLKTLCYGASNVPTLAFAYLCVLAAYSG